jgi:hypothetical protein
MKGLFDYIIKPKEGRTESVKEINGKKLILNADLQDHRYVSRVGVVIGTPSSTETCVREGDEVIVHHNVFRRFKDVRGVEKNSRSFFKDDVFFANQDQVYMYRRGDEDWKPLTGYNYIKPIHETDIWTTEKEVIGVGVIKYADDIILNEGINPGDTVGFRPGSEFEFVINNERLYRVLSKYITARYGTKGYKEDQREYNPIRLQSN